MMPSSNLHAGLYDWMPHQQLKMLVPVILLRTSAESAASKFQGRLAEPHKTSLFT